MKRGCFFAFSIACFFSLHAEEPSKSSFFQQNRNALFFGERLTEKKASPKKTYKRLIRHKHVQNSPYDWGWGTRVGAWHTPSSSEWDFAALYTRLHSQSFENVKTEAGSLLPLWKESLSSETAWQLYLDLADVEMGRKFDVKKNLIIRSHAGLRGAWIYQKCAIVGIPEEKGVPKTKNSLFIGGRCGGLGVRSGLDSIWEVAKGFSFFCDGAFSALASYIPRLEQDAEKNQVLHKGIIFAEALLGCQYVTPVFAKNTMTCSLGYELNYVFNQTRWMQELIPIASLYPQEASGVSLQGLSFTFRLDF